MKLTAALFLLVCALPAVAQKNSPPAGEALGPWLLGTIGAGNNADPSSQNGA